MIGSPWLAATPKLNKEENNARRAQRRPNSKRTNARRAHRRPDFKRKTQSPAATPSPRLIPHCSFPKETQENKSVRNQIGKCSGAFKDHIVCLKTYEKLQNQEPGTRLIHLCVIWLFVRRSLTRLAGPNNPGAELLCRFRNLDDVGPSGVSARSALFFCPPPPLALGSLGLLVFGSLDAVFSRVGSCEFLTATA